MKYISLFSGIGGLEASRIRPALFCELDAACRMVLARSFPRVPAYPDLKTLPKVKADVCVAGWPCQDLTIAGRQAGLEGSHSSLFFEMVRFAVNAKVHTIVAENVPNLISIHQGRDFASVLKTFQNAGYVNVAWRLLNARHFGLPQDRERLVLVASKRRSVALALHRAIPDRNAGRSATRRMVVRQNGDRADGFYWTGGLRSICYSQGYVPALKVGASPPKGGTSPVAVTYAETVRKLSPEECVVLQGFNTHHFNGIRAGDIYRMAGNAVPRPMGAFAVDTVSFQGPITSEPTKVGRISRNGFLSGHELYAVPVDPAPRTDNLHAFLDRTTRDSLSPQAAAGLLVRVIRSGKAIPLQLFDLLFQLSLHRTPLRGTKVDSFRILHEQMKPLQYRASLAARLPEGRAKRTFGLRSRKWIS